MKQLNASYWNNLYNSDQTGWDIGYASPSIVEYFAQLKDKQISILIPGAGNAWEAEYLWKEGFSQVYLLDFSEVAINKFRKRVPDFPLNQILKEDFFLHQKQYDRIVEQTFFSSLETADRGKYSKKIHQLLKPKGKLIGLLFNHEFNFNGPPFGGSPKEYQMLFKEYFHFKIFEKSYNSIKPRKGREHFILFEKR
ncbi:MAG: methyltransferase domain-containing protein [Bacteroidales bacterium]|nr:methyltransferase domain-containing protein [Bacteroidales bacterium]